MAFNQENSPWRFSSGQESVTSMPTMGDFLQPQSIYNPSIGLQQQQNRFMMPPMGVPQPQICSPTVQYPAARTMDAIRFPNQPLSPVNRNAFNPNNRVYTGIGTVTKTHSDWGYVDGEVFFHKEACDEGMLPTVGDRVLVKANYNSNMPFKWTASRVQFPCPTISGSTVNSAGRSHGEPTYNPMSSGSPDVETRSRNRYNPTNESPERRAHRAANPRSSKDQSDQAVHHRGRVVRNKSDQQRERSYERREKERSPSPKRNRVRLDPRYMVHVPKHLLTLKSADVLELRRRYHNLYIPSDFFVSDIRWTESFSPGGSFSIRNPCPFHIMPKGVDSPERQLGHVPAPLHPADANYLYSAKVMLVSTPNTAEFYKQCSSKTEDRDGVESDYIHPSRLISFLVGTRGHHETMAIGGPWSPSLDGLDPHSDPSVLIRTAIRTCKAMTGIDLSMCTLWCRFVELYYHRSETLHKGQLIPPRVETVVIFLPDVRTCQPSLSEWEQTRLCYKTGMTHVTNRSSSVDRGSEEANPGIVERQTQHDAAATQGKSPAAAEATSSTSSMLLSSLSTVKFEDDTISLSDEESPIKPGEPVPDRGYVLPEKPHIIVHPSRVAKAGKFGCSVMSLSKLLDYRPEDKKERSFEVSLFAELFNEMLTRDFGFTIYKELCLLPAAAKTEGDQKDGPAYGTTSSIGPEGGKSSGNDPQMRSKVRKRKRMVRKCSARHSGEDRRERKLATEAYAKPDLMLSFFFFDVTRCGYIFEEDVEDILYTLGLNLSRSQIHKIVAKATVGDTLQYRRLAEQTTGETVSDRKKLQGDASGTASDAAQTDLADDGPEKATSDTIVAELACGNTNYRMQLKQSLDRIANEPGGAGKQRKSEQNSTEFETGSNEGTSAIQSGFVEYQGSIIDVAKLLQRLKRVDETLATTEKMLQVSRTQNTELTSNNNRATDEVKELVAKTNSLSSKLVDSQLSVLRLSTQIREYYTILHSVHNSVEPVVSSKRERETEKSSVAKE